MFKSSRRAGSSFPLAASWKNYTRLPAQPLSRGLLEAQDRFAVPPEFQLVPPSHPYASLAMFPVASAAETRASCNGFSTWIVGDRPLAGHPPEPVRDKSWTVRREVHLP